MTQQAHLDPAPFFLEGGPVGVLLIHGFTGSPPEMRLLGDYLHGRGCTVSAPLLPGHGTQVEDMNRCRWSDWTGHAGRALAELQTGCETVFVAGLSMGAVIALYLAAQHPELAGAAVYSPAVIVADRLIYLSPVMKHVIPVRAKSGRSDLTDPAARERFWSYEQHPVRAAHELLKLTRQVRALLPCVACPLLVVHSVLDQAIHRNSARYTYEHAGSADKELITLHRSGHCLTADSEWKFVAEKTHQFVLAHAPAPSQEQG